MNVAFFESLFHTDMLFLCFLLQVFVSLFSAHMDPDVWANPSEFQPERFLDQDGHVSKKDAVIPFSVG